MNSSKSDTILDLDKPRWNQKIYSGRVRHFFTTTNPLNLFKTPHQLEQVKEVVNRYRSGKISIKSIEEEDHVWRSKQIYDSAFHPDTGEKMFILGRMSAQVPMNMTITGCMMTFYQTTPQVIFWQWVNQSFNALVNYTNRSGDTPISISTLGTSYVAATGGALFTALSLNSMVKSLPPLIGRLVPFAAVSAANCVNIPLMRRSELQSGIPVMTESGEKIGLSKIAAREGILKVLLSRIIMAAPGMVIIPIIMNNLEKRGFLKRFPRLNAPLQIGLCGFILTFATPLCCAIFQQQSTIQVKRLEPELQIKVEKINKKNLAQPNTYLYYNKGL